MDGPMPFAVVTGMDGPTACSLAGPFEHDGAAGHAVPCARISPSDVRELRPPREPYADGLGQ
jgi:hypothetical protein